MESFWKVEFFVDTDGVMPVRDYLTQLELGELKRFQVAVERLSQQGLMLGSPYSDKIDANLYELRLANSPHNSRFLYCAVIGRSLFLLHGFSKTGAKTDKVPASEIRVAKKRREVLLQIFLPDKTTQKQVSKPKPKKVKR